MTQGEIEALTVTMEQAASRLEMNIMKDIVRRIKANSDTVSYTHLTLPTILRV